MNRKSITFALITVAIALAAVLWLSVGSNIDSPDGHHSEASSVESPLAVESSQSDENVRHDPNLQSKPVSDELATTIAEWNAQLDRPIEHSDPLIVSRQPIGASFNSTDYVAHRGSERKLFRYEVIQSAVDKIIGADEVSVAERHQALYTLQYADLPRSEAQRLLNYLSNSDRLVGMDESIFPSFYNSLHTIFYNNPNIDDRYLEASLNVINDLQEHEVLRDYSVQGISRATAHANGIQVETIEAVLWGATSYSETSLPATALLALNRLEINRGVSSDSNVKLVDFVEKVIRNTKLDPRTRTAAIQLAGEWHRTDIVPVLIDIIKSNEASSTERAAAIGALQAIEYAQLDALCSQAIIEHPGSTLNHVCNVSLEQTN